MNFFSNFKTFNVLFGFYVKIRNKSSHRRKITPRIRIMIPNISTNIPPSITGKYYEIIQKPKTNYTCK